MADNQQPKDPDSAVYVINPAGAVVQVRRRDWETLQREAEKSPRARRFKLATPAQAAAWKKAHGIKE